MKWFVLVFVAILLYLQYRFWFDQGGYRDLTRLQSEIALQKAENDRLIERNRILAAEVKALKNDDGSVEERARIDLGMIKKGESFFMIVPKDQEPMQSGQAK